MTNNPLHEQTMSRTKQKGERRQQILESLAKMLEASPGARITTAKLANQVGVSEAALYRHFPSKTKMFEGLIEFIEVAIFSRVQRITTQDISAANQCEQILSLLLLDFFGKKSGYLSNFNRRCISRRDGYAKKTHRSVL